MRFVAEVQSTRPKLILSQDKKLSLFAKVIEKKWRVSMTYLKSQDITLPRIFEPYEVGTMEYQWSSFVWVKWYCHTQKWERVFRIDRILEIEKIK